MCTLVLLGTQSFDDDSSESVRGTMGRLPAVLASPGMLGGCVRQLELSASMAMSNWSVTRLFHHHDRHVHVLHLRFP
jgi:hypothetical protein